MHRIQLQIRLSLPKFFQQFDTEVLCMVMMEKMLGTQGFSCRHCSEIAPCLVQECSYNTFQCQTCRYQTSFILNALFPNNNLPLTIWYLGIYPINRAIAALSALALKCRLIVNYLSACFFKFNLKQIMAERQARSKHCDSFQIDDAYLGGAYRVFDFNKYASRCLVFYPGYFNRRFDHKTLRSCFLLGATVTCPRADARHRSAEASY